MLIFEYGKITLIRDEPNCIAVLTANGGQFIVFLLLLCLNDKKAVAVYARVSTDKQTVDMQIAELREFAKRSSW